MEVLVAVLAAIVLVIAALGGGTGSTAAAAPASVPSQSASRDWLTMVALIFLLGVIGLTLLGLVRPYFS